MKFGLMVEQDTRNIGDDVQAYVTKRFLPRVDYYVDRNHIDEFVPDTEEKNCCNYKWMVFTIYIKLAAITIYKTFANINALYI